jgi:hypothetical protein
LRTRAPSLAFGGALLLTTREAEIHTGRYELDPTEVLHLERRVDAQGLGALGLHSVAQLTLLASTPDPYGAVLLQRQGVSATGGDGLDPIQPAHLHRGGAVGAAGDHLGVTRFRRVLALGFLGVGGAPVAQLAVLVVAPCHTRRFVDAPRFGLSADRVLQ